MSGEERAKYVQKFDMHKFETRVKEMIEEYVNAVARD